MNRAKLKHDDSWIRRSPLKTAMKKAAAEELDVLYEEFETDHRGICSRQQTARSGEAPATPLTTARMTARGERPATRFSTAHPFRPGTVRNQPSRCGTARPITGTVIGDHSAGLNRPLTAIRGAGYAPQQSKSNSQIFDPMQMGQKCAVLKLDPEESALRKIRQLELKIWSLIDDSAMASHEKNFKRALELAKEAELKEKVLQKQEEEDGFIASHDWDLTFTVIFNLALQYEENNLLTDALNYYSALSGEKYTAHGPKVKLNIGNIFVKKRQFAKAIKIYRIALDQLGQSGNKRLRIKLLQNTGLVFLEMNNYSDAATNFETIMVEKPSFAAAFNLVVANYMLQDPYATKSSFQELLQIPLPREDQTCLELKDDPDSHVLLDLYSHDELSKYNNEKRVFAEKCVLTAACLIAPLVEASLAEGYDWILKVITTSQHAAFAPALEISKSVQLIKQGSIDEAISILQEFERKETKFQPAAANNLSFIYYLQGEYSLAVKYGEMAVSGDCYSEKAFVNLGNSLVAIGDLDRARALYFAAYRLDSSSIEVMYNLGLIDQRLGHYDNALMSFSKILHVLPNFGDALYQMGLTYELMKRPEDAIEYYLKTLAIHQNDSGLFKKLGLNADRLGWKDQAYSYYSEAYKGCPSDPFVIKWLAMYMIEAELPDQAMDFFHKGLQIDPSDPLWLLSMGSCQKQLGNTSGAIQYYKQTLQDFPDDLQALEGLLSLTKCMDRKEAAWYRARFDEISCRLSSQQAPRAWEVNQSGTARNPQHQNEDMPTPRTPRCPRVQLPDMNSDLWNFEACGKLDEPQDSEEDESI